MVERIPHMKTTLLSLVIFTTFAACRDEFHQLTPPDDSSVPIETRPVCQAPPIDKNIVGTWHFESNFYKNQSIRTGSVTFTAQNNIIDPDSLFENYIDTGSKQFKVINKIYTTNGTSPTSFPAYTGKIFRVDLLINNSGMGTIWPLYVDSNDCNKIRIYQLASYDQAVKLGFTLTR